MVDFSPAIPVAHDGPGQQDADATRKSGQDGKPPGPAVNGFHGGVKAHGPTPKQCSPFRSRAAIGDLLNLTLTTIAADGKNGRTMHREQESRPIKEDDREAVERIVEQIAVGDGEDE